ncbi:MAG: citrate synthase [Planctomycetota bacterium]|nr:citrate synthase [Planctomycetota bacterium]
MSTQEKTLVPGLAGIPASESAVSYIDGQAGVLEYRGYPIADLAANSTFEEVVFLLWNGRLPKSAELAELRASLVAKRSLAPEILEIIKLLPAGGHPMDALQTTVSLLGMHNPKARDFKDADVAQDICLELVAVLPTLVAAFDRSRRGLEIIQPDPDLDTAANFLWMINGEKPEEIAARTLDVALILHADHTMNASTFTARVVASAEADPYSVISAAVGTLSGPLHGGANERVLDSLAEIPSAEAVPTWLDAKFAAGGKVMGFGHRVYSVKDPRAHNLQGLVHQVFEKLGSTPIYDVALALETEMAERVGHKGIWPNVDFFSGIVYQKLGIATDLFTPVFAISRVSGWLAHWQEQMKDNKLFRPGQIYVGTHGHEYVPIDER